MFYISILKEESVIMATQKSDVVQVRNPRTGHYVKIDRSVGKIVAHKKSERPYKNVPVARKTEKGT